MSREIGKFYLDREYYLSNDGEVLEIFSIMKFLPLRVELLAGRDQFEFVGVSMLFDEVETGEEALSYDIVIVKDEKNQIQSVQAFLKGSVSTAFPRIPGVEVG